MTGATASFGRFRDRFGGEIILPGDQTYDTARVVWNGTIDRHPAVIARASGVDDVLTALAFARDEDMLIAVRSGGHSIPGLSTCDGGIVIDLSRMRGVRVDPERRTARVNGGALLGELDEQAQAFGLVCPVGVVSHTGIAGLTLGGGMGRLQRRFGLTIDNLSAVEMVTADGRRLRASDEENPDLFWGLRGAGANFGIATAFEFRLHPLDGTVTQGFVGYPIERGRNLVALFRELEQSGPDELMVTFGVSLATPIEDFPPEIGGKPIAMIGALHCGTVEQAERDLAPVRTLGTPLWDTLAPKPYLEAQRAADEDSRWGRRFSMRSLFSWTLPDDAAETFAERLLEAPAGAEPGYFVWSWGRAIARVDDEATAFTGRTARCWIAAEIVWDDPALDEQCRAWGRTALDHLMRVAVTGRYVNDVAEADVDGLRSVYGEDKLERLRALKRTWDPDNVFRLNQNIAP